MNMLIDIQTSHHLVRMIKRLFVPSSMRERASHEGDAQSVNNLEVQKITIGKVLRKILRTEEAEKKE